MGYAGGILIMTKERLSAPSVVAFDSPKFTSSTPSYGQVRYLLSIVSWRYVYLGSCFLYTVKETMAVPTKTSLPYCDRLLIRYLSISLLFHLAGLRCKNVTWKSYTLLVGANP